MAKKKRTDKAPASSEPVDSNLDGPFPIDDDGIEDGFIEAMDCVWHLPQPAEPYIEKKTAMASGLLDKLRKEGRLNPDEVEKIYYLWSYAGQFDRSDLQPDAFPWNQLTGSRGWNLAANFYDVTRELIAHVALRLNFQEMVPSNDLAWKIFQESARIRWGRTTTPRCDDPTEADLVIGREALVTMATNPSVDSFRKKVRDLGHKASDTKLGLVYRIVVAERKK